MAHHFIRRSVGVIAGAAALTLGTATAASAHHCYKVDWNDKAAEQLARNSTAWVSLTDLGAMIIAEEIGIPECAGYSSVAVEHWMAETGATSVPLIHSKATVGGGAYYNKGKAPKPFGYLGEADFTALDEGLGKAIDACMADAGA
ncbi:hypothetical protein O9K63_15900 [Janibacter cremeus]|uniref:hypothetical protein n=1 Tax=Janibacter cremeus TaxID=1285192 RepID=UPI0023F904A0|nr:hypothetical protein [Janibacter cremeus]WEV78049.1 hypothetical protein O9K63_15900 [Janibacter cremeus]